VTAVTRRRGIVLLALIGVFLSAYLFLHALGFYGELVCGAGGGCSRVQASRWATFLGFPVAGWGLGWYAAVLAVSLLAIQTSLGAKRGVSMTLLVLAAGGLGFTIYLKSVEIFVIHAICRWCVGSAVLALSIFVLALPEWRLVRRGATGV